jgi:hypothetical protein
MRDADIEIADAFNEHPHISGLQRYSTGWGAAEGS